jgi:hypothetical protein
MNKERERERADIKIERITFILLLLYCSLNNAGLDLTLKLTDSLAISNLQTIFNDILQEQLFLFLLNIYYIYIYFRIGYCFNLF